MAWLSAITQLLGAIVWPLTLVILLVLFRRDLRELLRIIREVK